jgi:hypothetical protein
MKPASSAEALARATSALVAEHDVTDVLASLLSDALGPLGARAGGILLSLDDGRMELLAATSHRTRDLELFQVQEESGPCIDAVRSGQALSVEGADELVRRWPEVGEAILAAGHTSVHAYPMHWHGTVLGAMNVFHDGGAEVVPDDHSLLGQAFADIATLVIVHPELSVDVVHERTRAALAGRTVVEQAKGVVAYRDGVSVEEAYDRLRELARERGATLTELCAHVVMAASRGAREY